MKSIYVFVPRHLIYLYIIFFTIPYTFTIGLFWQAEARLAQRRAARAEARELRLRELEKQQHEQDNEEEKQFASPSYTGESESHPCIYLIKTMSHVLG